MNDIPPSLPSHISLSLFTTPIVSATHLPVMLVQNADSPESIHAILTCNSDEYWDSFDNQTLPTDVLSNAAVENIIRPNSERLRAADKRYCLDLLLSALLDHAPHPLGKRYIAVCLDIANEKGHDGVVNAARVWMQYLLLPSQFVYSRLCVYLLLNS